MKMRMKKIKEEEVGSIKNIKGNNNIMNMNHLGEVKINKIIVILMDRINGQSVI